MAHATSAGLSKVAQYHWGKTVTQITWSHVTEGFKSDNHHLELDVNQHNKQHHMAMTQASFRVCLFLNPPTVCIAPVDQGIA